MPAAFARGILRLCVAGCAIIALFLVVAHGSHLYFHSPVIALALGAIVAITAVVTVILLGFGVSGLRELVRHLIFVPLSSRSVQDPLLEANDKLDNLENLYMRESTAGARLPPSRYALCLCPCYAISGYENGDPIVGACSGDARRAWAPLWGSLYALWKWQPNPGKIKGDGRQRTIERPCIAAVLVGSPCAISFWESGDLIMGLCSGDAKSAVVALLCSWGTAFFWYAPCAWRPKPGLFYRSSSMHSGPDDLELSQLVGNPVAARQGGSLAAEPVQNYLVCRNYHVGFQRQVELYSEDLGANETLEDCLDTLAKSDTAMAAWEHCSKLLYALKVPRSISLKADVPYHHAEGFTTFQKRWITLRNRHLDLTHGPRGLYKGTLGEAWSIEECIIVLLDRPDINYAVWRKDKDNMLHIFDTSQRVVSNSMRYYELPKAVSFQRSGAATLAEERSRVLDEDAAQDARRQAADAEHEKAG